MQKNSSQFSIEQARRLAESPAGQQLLSKLTSSGNMPTDQLRKLTAEGNYAQAIELLKPLLKSPEIQNLMKQLGG